MSRIYIKCIRRWAGEGAVPHSAHVHRKLFLGSAALASSLYWACVVCRRILREVRREV